MQSNAPNLKLDMMILMRLKPALIIGLGLVVLSMLVGCGSSADSRATLFQRPLDNYELRRNERGDYFVGALILSFDERTGDQIDLTTRLLVNLQNAPVVAAFHFQVKKHYGDAEYRHVNSALLVADGLTLVNADKSNKVKPYIEGIKLCP